VTEDRGKRIAGYWPADALQQRDSEAADYFRRAYYLVGMLYAAGLGDEAIRALCEAGKASQRQFPS